LTWLTLRSLLRGTKHQRAEEFHCRLEATGATLEVAIQQDFSVVRCLCLRTVLSEVFPLVLEMLAEPAFLEEEVSRERQRQEVALEEQCQEVEALARFAFFTLAAAGHPYSQPRLGKRSVLPHLTADACRRWYEVMCRAVPRIVLIGGDLRAEEALQWLERLQGAFPAEGVESTLPPLAGQWQRRVALAAKPGALQSALTFGLPAPRAGQEAYPAAYLIAASLGGYFLARLNRRLREYEGMTYGVSAVLLSLRAGGLTLIETSLATEQLGHACARVLDELEWLQHNPLPQEEFQRVLRVVYGATLRQTVTLDGILGLYSSALVHGLASQYPQHFLEALRRLTPEELLAVQRDFFRPELVLIAAAGDPEEVAPQLAGFGRVETVPSPCES